MATKTEIKSLETIAGEGWVKCDSPSDFFPTAAGYIECASIKETLSKHGIPSKIIYDGKAKTQNKLQIYVSKDNYEKAVDIAKRGA